MTDHNSAVRSSEDEKYLQKLLHTWEETYKKGQLTLWTLLALLEQPHYVSSLRERIQQLTEGTMSAEEQSLYRSLRKLYDLEIVDYETRDGKKGPDRKYYRLTPIGEDLLNRFLERNIRLFLNDPIRSILEEER